MERRALELIERTDELGGAETAIAEGFFQEEIGRSAYEHQMRVESGATIVVGVNRFTDDSPALEIPSPDYGGLEVDQVAALKGTKQKRDNVAVRARLDALTKAASELMHDEGSRAPMMEPILDAVRARATVGEISSALQSSFGSLDPSA
jgi:methylmalonyl-CoA mutase N-terminal domain/subunit